MGTERWVDLLGADPREWLLQSDEPAARWVTMTRLLDLPAGNPDIIRVHSDVIADPGVRDLLDRLVPWEQESVSSGHDRPDYTPNLLTLLGDMGFEPEDDPRFAAVLSSMLEHQDTEGRFQSFARWRSADVPVWGAMLCDAHAITAVLARFGYADDFRVIRALERMTADMTDTAQGRAWPCREDPAVGFRGPGRRADFCPQVTLEALRAFAYLPPERRPPGVIQVGRVSLRAWRERGKEKPYMFGHGRQFKRVKWPVTWYGAYEMADVLGCYPELWDGPAACPEDRRALAEVVACLVAYNVDHTNAGTLSGRITPRSCFRGFESYSFGQKKRPSAFATACVAAVIRRLDPLAELAAEIDVLGLESSKGGSGTALAP